MCTCFALIFHPIDQLQKSTNPTTTWTCESLHSHSFNCPNSKFLWIKRKPFCCNLEGLYMDIVWNEEHPTSILFYFISKRSFAFTYNYIWCGCASPSIFSSNFPHDISWGLKFHFPWGVIWWFCSESWMIFLALLTSTLFELPKFWLPLICTGLDWSDPQTQRVTHIPQESLNPNPKITCEI